MRDAGHEHFDSVATGMAAERLCERAMLDFTAAFDIGDVESMARNFAEDGVWKRQDGVIAGIAQLRQMMGARPAGLHVRHVLSNVRTTFVSASEAEVESYVTVYRQDFAGAPRLPAPLAGPNLVGRYRDRLSLRAGGWKLAAREVIVDFKQQPEKK